MSSIPHNLLGKLLSVGKGVENIFDLTGRELPIQTIISGLGDQEELIHCEVTHSVGWYPF